MANLWLNNISNKLISDERCSSNGKPFRSVLFPFEGGMASVTVSPKQIRKAMKRTGAFLDGFFFPETFLASLQRVF